MKASNSISLFLTAVLIATGSLLSFNNARANMDPCNGPCVRKVVECPKGGSKCSGSGNECGQSTICQGG
jgi:hypothetical protein